MCFWPPGFTSEDYSEDYLERIPLLQLPRRQITFRLAYHHTVQFTSKEQYDYGPIFQALGGLVASPATSVVNPE